MAIKKIATVTVPAGGSSTIQFSNIPQTYTDLWIVATTRNSGTYEHVLIGVNASTANFSGTYLSGYGSSGQTSTGNYARYLGNTSRDGYTANAFGSTNIYIPNYTSSANKIIRSESVSENNDASNWAAVTANNTWAQSAAITSIELTNEAAATILEGSTATLYGITNGALAGVTVA